MPRIYGTDTTTTEKAAIIAFADLVILKVAAHYRFSDAFGLARFREDYIQSQIISWEETCADRKRFLKFASLPFAALASIMGVLILAVGLDTCLFRMVAAVAAGASIASILCSEWTRPRLSLGTVEAAATYTCCLISQEIIDRSYNLPRP